MYKVKLCRVIFLNELNGPVTAYVVTRDFVLPIPPFVGLTLTGFEALPDDWDESEDKVVGVDVDEEGVVTLYLERGDYTHEDGEYFTAEDLYSRYRRWTVTPQPAGEIGRRAAEATAANRARRERLGFEEVVVPPGE